MMVEIQCAKYTTGKVFDFVHLCLCHPTLSMKALCFQDVHLFFVHRFIHLSGQILLPRYLMNGLSNLDKTYGEYSLAPTDELIRF